MLLTITCTPPEGAAWPATDLGFLLHKNPDRVQAFEQSYGTAHVVYPEASAARCTAALLLEVDPIRLVRGRSRSTPDFSLGQYVNDRPYAASSLLSVALGAVFRTALHGRCDQRPELAQTALPLRIALPAVPCKGGPEAAERAFAPLGWTVLAEPLPLDPAFPEWGDSHYVRLELAGTIRLADALAHLYVLLPVLDGAKHYWLAADEVDKLIRAGAGWLAEHPERGWITRRYLARRQSLVRTALARLAEVDDAEAEELDAVEEGGDEALEPTDTGAVAADWSGSGPEAVGNNAGPGVPAATRSTEISAAAAATVIATASEATAAETTAAEAAESEATSAHATAAEPAATEGEERAPSLAVTRRAAVLAALRGAGARRVLDLGCGEGALLRELLADKAFTEVVGVDVSMRALNITKRRLRLDRMPERVARRLTLLQGALTYTDARLRGYDAAVLMEVVEHVDEPRLGALEYSVFGSAAPGSVVVTTPNTEHNVVYETLPAGKFRHSDHRFEWTRAEFADWASRVAERYGYAVRFVPVGVEHPEFGPPTQLALFAKATTDSSTRGAA
ncbi:3' terminal RNA ribose 2'-O-methyltransferase Hen1 [Nocardia pseudovaccinii]|uniref:3' terminal RNA ribose 2'-O-methyltransferase Hen1 n=1 Tax=Nocardia pseudovaccinii TaxID=189540 RepID=UPI0007A3B182|nr:3' terminal RNA ribose 2'-O-methyltransferase Hen1 [Nocardia pseudovaccinii]